MRTDLRLLQSAPLRPLLQLAAIALAVTATAACIQPTGVRLEFTRSMELNPRLRLDREPLDPAQLAQAEYTGTYRDGQVYDSRGMLNRDLEGSEVIAPLTPTGIEPEVLEKLMQSNCLWQGDAQAGATSDVAPVSASWEFVAEVRREPMHLACDSPVRFGLCRLRDPVTASPIVFQPLDDPWVACPGSEPPALEALEVDFGGVELRALALKADSGPVQFDEDLGLAIMPLVSEFHLRAVPADPKRSCPGSVSSAQPIVGATVVAAPLDGTLGCRTGGSAPGIGACARDCLARAPAGDAALMLRDTTRNATRWLRPNLMVIDATGSMTRPLAADGNVRAWQVGVSADGRKWHENFTPDLKVASVRVFIPGPDPAASSDDRTPALAIFQDPNEPTFNEPALILRGSYRTPNGDDKVFRTVCRGMPTANGWEFPLETGSVPPVDCAGDQTSNVELGVTPAYVTNHLNLSAVGVPFNVPLEWSVELAAPGNDPLEIEFRLRATGGRASQGLLAHPAGTDFGGVLIGGHDTGWLEYRNVGDRPLTVVAASLAGTDPADFSYRLVAAHTPLPLPLAVTTTPGKRVISRIENGSSFVSDRTSGATVGPAHIRIVRPARDGQVLNVYGNRLRWDGDLAFPDDNTLRPVPWKFPPGAAPLDVLDAWTEARLPLVLAPGRSLRVAVKAQPRAPGLRRAALTVEADTSTVPRQRLRATAALEVDGDTGAMPDLLPARRSWGTIGRAGATRVALLVNNGDRDLVRRKVGVSSGSGFTLEPGNSPTQVLAPGTSEVFTVRYAPLCPWPAGAATGTLRVETDAGVLNVMLDARADCR